MTKARGGVFQVPDVVPRSVRDLNERIRSFTDSLALRPVRDFLRLFEGLSERLGLPANSSEPEVTADGIRDRSVEYISPGRPQLTAEDHRAIAREIVREQQRQQAIQIEAHPDEEAAVTDLATVVAEVRAVPTPKQKPGRKPTYLEYEELLRALSAQGKLLPNLERQVEELIKIGRKLHYKHRPHRKTLRNQLGPLYRQLLPETPTRNRRLTSINAGV